MPFIPPPQALYGYVGQGAQIAVATGIITSGLVAGTHPLPSTIPTHFTYPILSTSKKGVTLSCSGLCVPSIFPAASAASTLVPANNNLLARQWARVYNTGKIVGPALASTSALSLFYAADAHWCVCFLLALFKESVRAPILSSSFLTIAFYPIITFAFVEVLTMCFSSA